MSSEADKAEEKAKQNHSKVFVIKAKPTGLKSAENFLKNRTWDIISSADMKTALATLFRHHIDYALIGVDHTHPHVLKLPDIIAQTIKIPVILFAETLTPQASQMLRQAKHPYVLFPPVSGPAIERMLLRIEKDRLAAVAAKNEEVRQGEAGAADNNANIRVAEGNGGAFAQNQMNSSFSLEDIAKLFEGDGQSQMHNATSDGNTGSLMSNMQGGAGGQSMSGGMQAGHGAGGAMNSTQAGANGGAMTGMNNSPTGLGHGVAMPDAATGGLHGALAGQLGGVGAAGLSGLQAGASTDPGAAKSASPQRNMSKIDISPKPATMPPRNSKSADENGVEPFSSGLMEAGGYHRQIPNQSILEAGTEHALMKSSALSMDAPRAIPLAANSNVGCFAVESSGVSGVIVVAFGSDLVIDKKFSHDLQDHLLLYMQENGIQFSIDDVMNLKIEQVAFEEWTQQEALFLRKSIHAGSELALAFFINTEPQGRLEQSIHNHMLKVNIDEIRADNSLEFDVYLYFPENQKYIRYVSKDGALSGNQWNRLTAGGVTEVHVKKEAESDISRYRMKNFLNDKITSFNSSRRKAA